jgi:iron complex outermembrane recepter protein
VKNLAEISAVNLWFVALLLTSLATAGVAVADEAAAVTTTDTMVVVGIQEALGEYNRQVAEGDMIEQVLKNSPFALIRRGSGWASDLYSDGFKRNDITVTVDGERFCTACPNRMDTKIAQVEMMDIENVSMSRNSAVLQSGLGGQINFRRRQPGEETMVYGQFMGTFDHTEEFDGSLSVEAKRFRFGGRYRTGNPYTNANGETYQDKYGYREAPTSQIYELRGHKAFDEGDAVVTYENTRDVLFPYLLMDERTNDHYQASGSYKGHRLYFNRNEHFMDNQVRESFAMTDMATDATNTMFGIVGDKYEVYARNWDADNRITPQANPAMGKTNHMLPDVWRIGASVQHELGDQDNPWLFMRVGVAQTKVHDDTQLARYQTLESDAELSKWSVPFGVTASHLMDLSEDFLLGVSAEVSSDAPSIEQQYISVDKPGTKPDWVGNPTLKDPVRATARAAVQRDFLKLEVFATHVWSYPYLAKRSLEGAMFQTYEGVDAIMAGANFFATWKLVDAGLVWNWGEKTEDNSPLAEIQPVKIYLAGKSPTYKDLNLTARYQHAVAQNRVDLSQNEESTGSWNTLDMGLVWQTETLRVAFDAENLTNSLYTQHLSYQRNPFASGARVDEPGRTFRLTATFKY